MDTDNDFLHPWTSILRVYRPLPGSPLYSAEWEAFFAPGACSIELSKLASSINNTITEAALPGVALISQGVVIELHDLEGSPYWFQVQEDLSVLKAGAMKRLKDLSYEFHSWDSFGHDLDTPPGDTDESNGGRRKRTKQHHDMDEEEHCEEDRVTTMSKTKTKAKASGRSVPPPAEEVKEAEPEDTLDTVSVHYLGDEFGRAYEAIPVDVYALELRVANQHWQRFAHDKERWNIPTTILFGMALRHILACTSKFPQRHMPPVPYMVNLSYLPGVSFCLYPDGTMKPVTAEAQTV